MNDHDNMPFNDPLSAMPFEDSQDTPYFSYDDRGCCDGCSGCITYCRYEPLPEEYDYMRLIDAMVCAIDHLEKEVVRWRQAIIKYLPEEYAEGLASDIFSNLSARFYDHDVYMKYVNTFYDGVDPLECDEHVAQMLRLRDGTDETSLGYL